MIVLVGASGSPRRDLNARVFQIATQAPTLAASVNTSAFNVGNALSDPAVGAWVIASGSDSHDHRCHRPRTRCARRRGGRSGIRRIRAAIESTTRRGGLLVSSTGVHPSASQSPAVQLVPSGSHSSIDSLRVSRQPKRRSSICWVWSSPRPGFAQRAIIASGRHGNSAWSAADPDLWPSRNRCRLEEPDHGRSRRLLPQPVIAEVDSEDVPVPSRHRLRVGRSQEVSADSSHSLHG